LALFNDASRHQLAIDVTWPSIEKGWAWLEENGVIPLGRRQEMVDDAASQAEEAWKPAVTAFDKAVSREAVESIKRGESGDQWHERVQTLGDIERHIGETVHRTLGRRAYYAGQTEALTEFPEVASRFPYMQYLATKDTRVRPAHKAMDEKVARIGSPLHDAMVKLIDEFNCRCSMVPLTAKQAQGKGIDDDSGAPPPPPPAAEQHVVSTEAEELAAPPARSRAPEGAGALIGRILLDRLTSKSGSGNDQRIPKRIRDLFPDRFREAFTTNQLFIIEGGRDWWNSNVG